MNIIEFSLAAVAAAVFGMFKMAGGSRRAVPVGGASSRRRRKSDASVKPGAWASRLVRVFVDVDCIPAEVVTVYQTSKIDKYWRTEP